MRPLASLRVLALLVALGAASHARAATCEAPGSLECPTYERYENHKLGFAVDVPAFFARKAADADGRGQPFELGKKARVRAWAMVDNPPMTVDQLYADWCRREGITFKSLAANTWVVRGKQGPRMFYSRSILEAGIIATIEVSYSVDVAAAIEPILARLGPSLAVLPRESRVAPAAPAGPPPPRP